MPLGMKLNSCIEHIVNKGNGRVKGEAETQRWGKVLRDANMKVD
jgi:hypothetical protein